MFVKMTEITGFHASLFCEANILFFKFLFGNEIIIKVTGSIAINIVWKEIVSVYFLIYDLLVVYQC